MILPSRSISPTTISFASENVEWKFQKASRLKVLQPLLS
jgi:hypothetical protein